MFYTPAIGISMHESHRRTEYTFSVIFLHLLSDIPYSVKYIKGPVSDRVASAPHFAQYVTGVSFLQEENIIIHETSIKNRHVLFFIKTYSF